MKSTLKHFYHTVCLTILVFTLVLAVLLSLMRLLTPLLANQHAAIERWASHLLNKPVQMKTITIHWHVLNPVLQGDEVVIWNDVHTRPLLKVDQLTVSLNLFDFLLSGRFKLARLHITGVHLNVQQMPDDKIQINGMDNVSDSASGTEDLLNWLFIESRLILENVDLTWHSKAGTVLPIKLFSLSLKNSGNHHVLSGAAELKQKIPTVVQFIVDLQGNWQAKEKITAKVYAHARDVVLTQWLKNALWQQYQVTDGVANIELWATWQAHQLQNVQTLFMLDQLAINNIATQQPIIFQPFIGNIYWEMQPEQQWLVDANFRNLGFTRWNLTTAMQPTINLPHQHNLKIKEHQLPGFTGLTGYAHITPTSGSLDLSSQQVNADFGALFKAPLKLDELTGHVDWRQQTDGWLVQGSEVNARNQDMAVNANFDLLIPKDKASPVINLLANAEAYSATHISHYLPLTIMQPALVKWLSHAITHADKGLATFVLQGRLADFPFDHQNGTFLIDVDVKGADVDYWPGWLPIKQADAVMIFAGRRMDIELKSAQILQTTLQNTRLYIPILKSGVQAILYADGDISSDLKQGLTFLQASPAREKLGNSLQGVSLDGPMQLNLQLAVPLEEGELPLTVKGHIETQNAELAMPERNVRLTNLQGILDFTKNNIVAPALTAQLWDKPITINLNSDPKLKLQIVYDNTPFNLLQMTHGWVLQIHNNFVDGNVLIPQYSTQPLQAQFNSLYIDPAASQSLSEWEPSKIPFMNFESRIVKYGEKNLGSVSLQLKPDINKLRIIDLRARLMNAQLVANGWWRQGETLLHGVLNSQNIAGFLRDMEFPVGITGVGKLTFRLHWPVDINNLNFAAMNGRMTLNIKQGQILDIGAKASAQMNLGRLLTSLSLKSLGRRFTTVRNNNPQGFEFDDMQGDFVLKNGNAYTTHLFLDGPVARINLSGRVGLAAQDYELMLEVIPHITASLPVVGAGLIVANPLVGASVLVADALLGSTVQQAVASRYHLTGTWAHPVVTEAK